ncbi:Neurotrimin [Armadillidium nasatum]|uniref:Neurotrimin n=1 Tax=Armadillidium nasatum TaxID=96803 RepID=A0A5N5TJ46_9CRUS|nr:Neurotrimin [Armadillidium nasatum]
MNNPKQNMLIILSLYLKGSCNGRLMGLSSPWLSSPHSQDHDYKELTPDDKLPKIVNKGRIFKVTKGEDVILDCDVIKLGEFSVIWLQGDKILWILQQRQTEPLIQYVINDERFKQTNTSLLIQNVAESDQGEYSCEISTDKEEKISHQLIVNVPPSTKTKGGIDFVQGREGDSITLECEASGNPIPQISWRKIVRSSLVVDFDDDSQTVELSSDNILMLTNITLEDSGIYVCTATNGVGNASETQITFDVQYAPVVKPVENIVHSGVKEEKTLWCVVKSSPSPKVDWYKGGTPVNPMRLLKGINTENRYSLHFDQVQMEDFGLYSCNASNYFGNDSATIELTGKPLQPKITSNPAGFFEDNYTLTWDVKSYSPVISYFVFLKNESLDSGETWVNITVPANPSSSIFHSQLYTLTDLSPGTRLIAQIKAINEFGESEFSDPFIFETHIDETDTNFDEEIIVDLSAERLESSKVETSESDFSDIIEKNSPPEKLLMSDSTNVTQASIQSVNFEGLQNVSSNGMPSMTDWEKRTQMMSIVTAISLSCFFYLFAMR